MSLASYHDGKTEVWKYSGMVSDQAVLHPAPPTKASVASRPQPSWG